MPEPHLRAVNAPDVVGLSGDGLTLAYAALKRVRVEHRLDRLAIAVDDARLGHQVLVVPRGQPAPAQLDPERGWHARAAPPRAAERSGTGPRALPVGAAGRV